MKEHPSNQASGASDSARFFCTWISSAAGAAGVLKQHKKEPNMANRNTDSGIGKTALPEVMNNDEASCSPNHSKSVGATNHGQRERLSVVSGTHHRPSKTISLDWLIRIG